MVADLALLFVTACVGYMALRIIRFPLPGFVGPLLSAGALNYLYLYPDVSLDTLSFLAKVGIGVTLGRRFDRGVLSTLRELPGPALLTAVWMMGASLISGWVLHAWTNLPLSTSLIGSAAGGITEMAIFAMALGANVVTVTFIQFFRLVFSIMAVPFLAKGVRRHLEKQGKFKPSEERDGLSRTRQSTHGRFGPRLYALMTVSALLVGGLMEKAGVPAGALLGAMVGTALVVMPSGRNCPVPHQLTIICQMSLGTIMAKSMTHDTIVALGELFLPLFVPTFLLLSMCLVLSLVLLRITRWDPITCLLATMPAGLIQIVPLAEEAGADVVKVGILHTVRLVSIVMFLPWIIRLIVS